MAKNKLQDQKIEEPKAEEPGLEETKAEPIAPPKNTEYEVIDALLSQIVFENEIFVVQKGRIACSPEVASKLIEAGFLKG